MATHPLVTVLVSVHDGEAFVRSALTSVLRQSVTDLELLVVDDGSTDRTPEIVAAIEDSRLRVLRNDARRGLAASLNRGLDEARGTYVARMDADDVALPGRLERQLERLSDNPRLGVVGSAILEIDDTGHAGTLHAMPESPAAVRWAALFSSPFYHPTVLVDRELLDRHDLRYDTSYPESEDYELWARLLRVADGANVAEPLVLYRGHAGQASRRRRGLQRALALEISLRQIAEVAPGLGEPRAELARSVGLGRPVAREHASEAAEAYLELLASFEGSRRVARGELRVVRESAARSLARLAGTARGHGSARTLRQALSVDPTLPVKDVARRARRRASTRAAHRHGADLLRSLPPDAVAAAISVAAIFPEPTPYRAPLLDRVAARPDIDLTVIYAAETVAGRTWEIEPRHSALYLGGVTVPGASRLLRHEYPLTTSVTRVLGSVRPDVVVVSGWSTFASQAAIVWSRARGIPYVVVVESHDEDPRPGWRRAVKSAVVPRVVRGSAGILAAGSLARQSMLARGAEPERVRIFANTIDVEGFVERAERLAPRRVELRRGLGAAAGDVAVLSVARLAPEKGLDTLVRAVAAARDERLVLVVVGAGPERACLESLARTVGVRLVLTGDRPWERIVEAYVAADVFALLSEREPWGVVVNEAAACGLPLVLSDRVGAAADLLIDGENGFLVGAGDVAAAAVAIGRLADDPELRASQGARSREIVAGWGYGPSVDGFVDAVRAAVGGGLRR